jgi:hypothetical protein
MSSGMLFKLTRIPILSLLVAVEGSNDKAG